MHKLLNVRYPIIQAPMAGSDNAAFVAAACNAGVLGSLGAQYRTPEEIKTTIEQIRALTNKPFAINLFALDKTSPPGAELIEQAKTKLEKYYEQYGLNPPSIEAVKATIDPEAQLQAALDARVAVVSFTLGMLSEKWMNAFKEASILLIGTATNVKEARALESAGVDMITAQGSEAGGHRGTFIGSMENSMIGGLSLIPQIVDAVRIPVIAAGGIMDGRGIAASFALGAKAVQIGTAFLTTNESPLHANFKRAIQIHDADETVITRVFSGGAARGIENKFIENNVEPNLLLPFPFHNALTRPIRKAANEIGAIDDTNLWSGQSGRLARQTSIEALVTRLVSETETVRRKPNPMYED